MNNYLNEIKISYKTSKAKKYKVTNLNNAVDFVKSLYKASTIELYETVYLLLLNNNNEITGYYKLTDGATNKAIIDSKLIFSIALKTLASGIIISHNHPSGRLEPSKEDISITKNLKAIGELLDITLLDHIIVTRNNSISFAYQGLL